MTTTNQAFVLYTDGSCAPNPGPGGWGFHGYLYDPTEPKKGAGNPDVVPTNQGYVDKSEHKDNQKGKAVTLIHYVDGFGTGGAHITNNIGEIMGLTEALKHASQYSIDHVLIRMDSKYAMEGYLYGLGNWSKNGWKRQDGQPVANVQLWQNLLEVKNLLLARNVKVEIEWVKGHATTYGNLIADRLAGIGTRIATDGKTYHSVNTQKPDGYWSFKETKHPFISHRTMIFNSQKQYNRPGVYFLGAVDKIIGLLGKKISDCAYSVVRLNTPDPMLEFIRDYQCKVSEERDQLIFTHLNALYRPQTHKDLVTHQGYVIQRTPSPVREHYSLEYVDKEPLTEVIDPPRLAMNAVESISLLLTWMDDYLAGNTKFVTTDLTPILYEQVPKSAKKPDELIYKLQDQYDVGYSALKIDANFPGKDGVVSLPLTLTMGIDLPDRNMFKRIEDQSPSVTLVSWLESENVYRYFTVVKTDDALGAWCGHYSNMRFAFEKAPKEKKVKTPK